MPLSERMLQGSWRKLDPRQGLGKAFGNRLPVIWEGSTPGDKIQFRFKGTMAGLYDLMGPDAGQVVWTVDDKAYGPQPRFDRYCTYHRLASVKLAENLADKEHTIAVEIDPKQPDRQQRAGPGPQPAGLRSEEVRRHQGLGRLSDDDRRPAAVTNLSPFY